MRLLIIDDDTGLVNLYSAYFTKHGYIVDSEVDGLVGYERILTEKPDVLIMGIMLSTMNGIEILEKIYKKPELKELRTVIVSNLDSDQVFQSAKDLGVLLCLSKGMNSQKEILTKVSEALDITPPFTSKTVSV